MNEIEDVGQFSLTLVNIYTDIYFF